MLFERSESALKAEDARAPKRTLNAWDHWKSCRAKTCCTRGARDVNGADIVRISRTLALEPWHFTQTAPAVADDPAGIVLGAGRRRVNLMLANAAHGCIFLIRTVSGAACCGLGDAAPVSCRVFPADPAAHASTPKHPSVRDDHGCQCREWTDYDLERMHTEEPLRVWAADRAHWLEVVARWNAQSTAPGAPARSVEDFQRYLLEAQASREVRAGWPEEVKP